MQTPGANRKGSIFIYIIGCVLVAASGSTLYPVLSYFLSNELHLNSVQLSIFYFVLPAATILVVQLVGRFSDMGLQRPAIICISSLFGVFSCLCLHLRPGFTTLMTIGIICFAIYPVAFPQIFASAREYANQHLPNSIMFTTFLRAIFSLVWVVGPPLSYAIALGMSFDHLFAITALMFALAAISVFFYLPNLIDSTTVENATAVKWWTNRSVILLFIGIALMFTAFSSYIVSMPLFLTSELQFDKDTPGYVMALCAFIEIPFMFLAAKITKVIGLKSICIVGGVFLVAYLLLLTYVDSSRGVLYIQICMAIFIALVTTMGMVLFQDLLPTIPGQATSLYINACTAGNIAGGGMISLQTLGSYEYIYYTGAILAALGTLALFGVQKPNSDSIHESHDKALPTKDEQSTVQQQ